MRKLRSYFSPFVDQSSLDYVTRRGRDRSLQRRFPIVDILFHPGDIRDRSAKSSEIAPKTFFGPKFFWGEDPRILDLFLKLRPFPIMWQSFAAIGWESTEISRWIKKERKERNKQQQNMRAAVALSQRAALRNAVFSARIKLPLLQDGSWTSYQQNTFRRRAFSARRTTAWLAAGRCPNLNEFPSLLLTPT